MANETKLPNKYITLLFEPPGGREDYKVELADGQIKRLGIDKITLRLRAHNFGKLEIEHIFDVVTNFGRVIVSLDGDKRYIIPR